MKAYIGPYQDHADLPQIINIEIDPWDSWSAYTTIAKIAAPVVKQLMQSSHGFANVKAEDVPLELQKHNPYDFFGSFTEEQTLEMQERWNYVTGEILWALEEIAADKPGLEAFYDSTNVKEGMNVKEMMQVLNIKHDQIDAYENRIQRSCELFGKYFQSLWD